MVAGKINTDVHRKTSFLPGNHAVFRLGVDIGQILLLRFFRS